MSFIRPHRVIGLARPSFTSASRVGSAARHAADPSGVAESILACRAEIASLEADWAAASERAAARSLGGVDRLGARETWDRATWDRYLAASVKCQHLFQPRLTRLFAEIERLERMQRPGAPRRRAA